MVNSVRCGWRIPEVCAKNRADRRDMLRSRVAFLHPERIHSGERARIFDFEPVPGVEVDLRGIAGEACRVRIPCGCVALETEKAQSVRGKERLDPRQRRLM